MELNVLTNELKNYGASGGFDAVAGEKVKVDIAGVKEFETTVPSGKKWNVNIIIKVEEEDL